MNSWRKLAWEVPDKPGVGDRVSVQSRADPTLTMTGVVDRIFYDPMTSTNIYVICKDGGDFISAFESQVRYASLWEVSPYRFQIGQQVKVRDSSEGDFPATIEQAARDSHDTFYVVRDYMGEPRIVDEQDLEAIPEEE